MPSLKTVLVVDDNAVNRTILSKIISEEYAVLAAENGQAALDLLCEHIDEISAVMLDLVMPVMDGYAFLESIRAHERYANLPIIVTTDNSDSSSEIKALTLGAWDFVSKPYNPEIIRFRLKNAIDRSQLSALKELKYLSEYDVLTGIYNKAKFFEATRAMIDANAAERFVFCRFDVDRFQLINSFFGTAEGDKLLVYIAECMAQDVADIDPSRVSYGRIESDVFCFCLPFDAQSSEKRMARIKQSLTQYNPNYDIVPSVGIYILDDTSISVEEMYNRAALAAKSCKGNYVDYYAYYNESMSRALSREQEIVNDMNYALEHDQFHIYLQPKYSVHTNLPCGAEALVRWMHPEKGMISPGEFIPVFERNGFITKLDYYVWEQACKCLHRWQERGIAPYPLSVNVSRVNVYNPNLAETLLELVTRYQLSPALLNLELTESAYTDNPIAMKKAMAQLQKYGFSILMDDFGSGYSSLSLLKDILIDVLKIDMRFLSDTEVPGRGENIIASVIRMAKWLNIPVIAEGAETDEQVDFLRSVGCDYVQGYFYARPMPVEEYETLCMRFSLDTLVPAQEKRDAYRYDDLFSANEDMKRAFGNDSQAAVVYESTEGHVEMIRVNEAYYALLGHADMRAQAPDILNVVAEEHRDDVLRAFRSCTAQRGTAECEYLRHRVGRSPLWVHIRLRYVATVGSKHVVLGELTDVTMRHRLDEELQKYRASWLNGKQRAHMVLIVDDAAINRIVLKKILQEGFLFLEAENGAQALEVLQENRDRIDLILLDISMPVMDGKEFLQHKKNMPEMSGIPVIMITADDSAEQQISTFSLGANDYIVKPFIPAVVTRRVKNVLESNQRFREMVKAYNHMSEQVKTDGMTGLINRVSAEETVIRHLESSTDVCAMLMLDIDNFKIINDTRGHDYGDKVICAVAETLRARFGQAALVARMGGDEFAVLIADVQSAEQVRREAHLLCESMAGITIDEAATEITCSVGIALSSAAAHTFAALYQNADRALYRAKCRGRNTVSMYVEEVTRHG